MSLENVRYDAFISYRHCELDSFVSENLHKKLESYRMPSSVIKKITTWKTKIERIFRDEAELPLSGNLSDPISEALDNSRFLIVICTPRLRESRWCLKEIETFIQTHDREHVLLVLAEGEPSESFPEIMLHEDVAAKDANGNDITVTVEREPLAADCRGDNNRDRLKKLDNVVLKLYAAMFGLNYDDLRQRHRERQVRRRIAIASTAFAILTVFAATCLIFTIKISRQNKIIADKYAGAMADASASLLSEGLLKDSIYAVWSVLPDNAASGYNADAYYALTSALAPYEFKNCYYPVKDIPAPKGVLGMDASSDMPYILVICDGYTEVVDINSSEEVLRMKSEYAKFVGDGAIYINDDLEAIHISIPDGSEKKLADNCAGVYYSPESGNTVLITYDRIITYEGARKTGEYQPGTSWSEDGVDLEDFSFSGDGKYAAFSFSSSDGIHTGAIDLTGGRFNMLDEVMDIGFPVVATDGETIYLYYEISDDWGREEGIITSIDIASSDIISERTLSGTGFFTMLEGDQGLLLVSDGLAYMLDKDLTDIDVITEYINGMTEFAYGDGFVLLDSTGRMHTANFFSTDRKAFELYGHIKGESISHTAYDAKADRLFIRNSESGRITVYENRKEAERVEKLPEDAVKTDYSDKMPNINDLPGIDEAGVFYASLSDDGKYIAVLTNDDSLIFFDAKTKKHVKTVYDSDVFLFHSSFAYLDKADVYIVENKIFDSDLNMTGSIGDGEMIAKDSDGNSIYIMSGYNEDDLYRIEILPYEELIRRADEALAGFTPAEDIKSRYSIN